MLSWSVRSCELRSLSGRYESELKAFLERLARGKISGATYRQVQFLLEWSTEISQVVELLHAFLEVQIDRERNEVFFAPKQRSRLVAMLGELALDTRGRDDFVEYATDLVTQEMPLVLSFFPRPEDFWRAQDLPDGRISF